MVVYFLMKLNQWFLKKSSNCRASYCTENRIIWKSPAEQWDPLFSSAIWLLICWQLVLYLFRQDIEIDHINRRDLMKLTIEICQWNCCAFVVLGKSDSSCLTNLIHVHTTSIYPFSALTLKERLYYYEKLKTKNWTEKELRKQGAEDF